MFNFLVLGIEGQFRRLRRNTGLAQVGEELEVGLMNPRRKPLAKLTTRLTLLALLGSGAFEVPAAQHSRLWGRSGELWSPPSRLPDFSYAGYRRGEKEIPRRAVDVSVKDFGARGDGRTDDTAAFQKAIAESAGKVIFVPRGNYRITDFLTIAASGTVLRGAGPTRSVFVFPKPLDSVKPNWGATTSGKRTSNYSWSGGYVRIVGQSSDRKLADVSSPAKRGDQSLAVSDPSKFQAGEDYELRMSDAGNRSLTKHLYAGDAGPISNLKNIRECLVFRVSRLDAAAKRIHFDRPLRTDVRAEWRPHLVAAKCSVEECGIEELGFAFPKTPYQGHFTELGFNAVDLRDVRHCWVRNIRIHNADSGVFVRGVNNTLTGLHITSARTIEKSRKATGHHGVTLGGQDNLLTRPILKDYGEEVATPSSSSNVLTLDLSTANVFSVTLDENVTTLTISNPTASGDCCSFSLRLAQDGTGSHTFAWPSAIDWAGGTAPTITATASRYDWYTFATVDGGTSWSGFIGGQDLT